MTRIANRLSRMGAAFLLGAGFVAGCGGHSAAGPATKARILVDAQGDCPPHPDYTSPTLPPTCRTSREGRANGLTNDFRLPRVPWGIAWSYRCKKGGDFYAVVGIPGGDSDMPDTQFYRRGSSGRGYVMETGKGIGTLESTPIVWANLQNIQIMSYCAWHVRAVVGSKAAVAQHVPPLPPVS